MTKKIDFKELDSLKRFCYRKDLIEIIKKHKFYYVSQYIYDRYYIKRMPVVEIAKELSLTKGPIYQWMKKWKFKTKQRGGNNRNPALKKKEVINKIVGLMGQKTVKETAEICGCSITTVRNLWKK
ncbi:MAG: hypothetical protein HOJ48_01195 [Desulfobacula sp.]|jgi:hypothetical protein|nr:hypothetical protein [Desulfobacula sp.]MBT6337890.1 hypothetical protein [Desulfobacula sp.]